MPSSLAQGVEIHGGVASQQASFIIPIIPLISVEPLIMWPVPGVHSQVPSARASLDNKPLSSAWVKREVVLLQRLGVEVLHSTHHRTSKNCFSLRLTCPLNDQVPALSKAWASLGSTVQMAHYSPSWLQIGFGFLCSAKWLTFFQLGSTISKTSFI